MDYKYNVGAYVKYNRKETSGVFVDPIIRNADTLVVVAQTRQYRNGTLVNGYMVRPIESAHTRLLEEDLALLLCEYGASCSLCTAKDREKTARQFYILWAPSSLMPPNIRFTDRDKAERLASVMAERIKSQVFVMQAVGVVNVETKVETDSERFR